MRFPFLTHRLSSLAVMYGGSWLPGGRWIPSTWSPQGWPDGSSSSWAESWASDNDQNPRWEGRCDDYRAPKPFDPPSPCQHTRAPSQSIGASPSSGINRVLKKVSTDEELARAQKKAKIAEMKVCEQRAELEAARLHARKSPPGKPESPAKSPALVQRVRGLLLGDSPLPSGIAATSLPPQEVKEALMAALRTQAAALQQVGSSLCGSSASSDRAERAEQGECASWWRGQSWAVASAEDERSFWQGGPNWADAKWASWDGQDVVPWQSPQEVPPISPPADGSPQPLADEDAG